MEKEWRTRMLNFKKFVEEVAGQVREQQPSPDCQVSVGEIIKNNHTPKCTLQIKQEGCGIAPNFYLEGYYEDYQDGRRVDEIGSMIWERYGQIIQDYDTPSDVHKSRDWIEKHVVYRIINRSANEEMLRETPHIVLEDLAVVFYLLVEQKQQQIASIRISYSFLEHIGLKEEELPDLADKNSRRLFPIYFAPITETICHFDGQDENAYVFRAKTGDDGCELQREFLESVIKEEDISPFFVLTNASGINGATVMLYSHVLKQIAEIMESNLYIIPSSIHEVLVIPRGKLTKKEMNAMIKTVNDNMIQKDEILSDHVYTYDPVLEQITS